MIVLINCLSSTSGGAISYLRNLVFPLYQIFEKSIDNSLIILAYKDQKKFFKDIPSDALMLIEGEGPVGVRRRLWEQWNIPRIAEKIRADVIYTPYQISGLVKGKQNVLMLRNMEPFPGTLYFYELRSRLRNLLLKIDSIKCLKKANRVLAVSSFVETYLSEHLHIPDTRVCTIYHGRDKSFSPNGMAGQGDEVIRKLGLSQGFILTCGSLLPYRRCEDVIDAFSITKHRIDQTAKLVIAGTGTDRCYMKQIDAAITKSGCKDQIVLLGQVTKETMQTLYSCCRICVLATEIEACPNIAIEAMSSGCVSVASDRPPLPEMFAGAAIHYMARDIEALESAIIQAWHDKNLRANMRVKALERSNFFSWEKCAEQTYSALVEW